MPCPALTRVLFVQAVYCIPRTARPSMIFTYVLGKFIANNFV